MGSKNGLASWSTYQFDRVLSKAIDSKNLVVLECLIQGRRWVSPLHADKCFENSRRVVDHLLEPLRKASVRASDEKPSVLDLKGIFESNSLIGMLNLLPTYFPRLPERSCFSNAGHCRQLPFNSHTNEQANLSRRGTPNLTKLFLFKSVALNSQINEDFEKIEELPFGKRRSREVRLTSGADKWEITKKGVKLSDLFILMQRRCRRYGMGNPEHARADEDRS